MLSSMLWTCSATRRTGLTYEEALESERTAMVLIVALIFWEKIRKYNFSDFQI